MTSHPQLTLCYALLLLCCPQRAAADKLQITSTPPGATVELDGVVAGTTPFEKDFPGGYFRKTRTSMGSRLEHPVVARISLAGYVSKEIKLTEGPMNWISLNGRNRGEYWLFKSAHFSVELQPISETFTGGITAKVSDSSIALAPELSLEELVRESKPAVVYLKGLDKSGSGFFVTGTGVIVTNAHLARRFYPHAVPRMERTSNFETGCANSTESVDSAGNSSSNASLSAPLDAVGTVSISSDPDGAEIFVDEKFHGNTPAMLKLTTWSHVIVLKFPGHADWRRTLEVLKSSKTSLKGTLNPAP